MMYALTKYTVFLKSANDILLFFSIITQFKIFCNSFFEIQRNFFIEKKSRINTPVQSAFIRDAVSFSHGSHHLCHDLFYYCLAPVLGGEHIDGGAVGGAVCGCQHIA